MILTLEYLKKVNAPQYCIDFVTRNGLLNLNLAEYEIIGHFCGLYTRLFDNKCKYDKRGNVIYEKNCDGDITRYKYDKNNNRIYENYSNKVIWKKKYNENNQLVFAKNNIGDTHEVEYYKLKKENVELIIHKFSYKESGNKYWDFDYYKDGLHVKTLSEDYECLYEYDERGNIIKQTIKGKEYIFEYVFEKNMLVKVVESGEVLLEIRKRNGK